MPDRQTLTIFRLAWLRVHIIMSLGRCIAHLHLQVYGVPGNVLLIDMAAIAREDVLTKDDDVLDELIHQVLILNL